MGMWEGKTGRIQSFNQAKKFTIMKKGTCNFHCLYCDTLPVSCCFTYSCRTLLKTFFFFKRRILNSPHVRESRKFCLQNPKSWALESGIQLKKSGISLTIGIQNSVPVNKDYNLVPGTGIHGVESRIQDCLGFPYMERVEFTCQSNLVT